MTNTTTKTLQIKNSGYYDGVGNKIRLLKEGDVLELIGLGSDCVACDNVKDDCWECRTEEGNTVFVEFENGRVSA